MSGKSEARNIDALKVTEYLRENPDFLVDNPDLLDVLAAPTRWEDGDGGNVVDMQTSMLDRMRDESTNLKDAANLLISTTRSNMMIQTRTHAAVIAILGADNLERLVHVVCFDLPLLLDIDAASLCLETGEEGFPELGDTDIRWFGAGTVDKVLGGPDEFAKLIEHTKDDGAVFGEAAGIVKSAALGRLQPGYGIPNGLLALGSRNRGAFHGGQGTDLLIFITRVLELTLHRWLAEK
ncbi:MAG: DUF484 family protein [Rhodospirillaceae bacterium]|jgi:uncharacterized protein|nr:DUF484 family protein [Rhodospirillaceae bacterium]MBT4940054.1 DUF484 family protein [Rhodospirillaceae bacterium]MBT5940801.1 DUF484 family protein [Rhodospirillaceae bacterium]